MTVREPEVTTNHPTERRAEATDTAVEQVEVLAELPIVFEAKGRTLPVPLVQLSVAGATALFILDTGASHHALTRQFAAAHSLSLTEIAAGTGHAGEAIAAWKVGSVPATLGALPVVLEDVAAIHGPPPFEPLGIGGFISPQHLHARAFAVMDFESNLLLLVDGSAEGIAKWSAERWPALLSLELPRASSDRKVMVWAAISPQDKVITELDSGGSGTEFAASLFENLDQETKGDTGRSVSGKKIEGVVVHDRRLEVGGSSLAVPSLLARPDMGGQNFQGLVGMDLLRGTTLMVTHDISKPVYWLVRQPPDRP